MIYYCNRVEGKESVFYFVTGIVDDLAGVLTSMGIDYDADLDTAWVPWRSTRMIVDMMHALDEIGASYGVFVDVTNVLPWMPTSRTNHVRALFSLRERLRAELNIAMFDPAVSTTNAILESTLDRCLDDLNAYITTVSAASTKEIFSVDYAGDMIFLEDGVASIYVRHQAALDDIEFDLTYCLTSGVGYNEAIEFMNKLSDHAVMELDSRENYVITGERMYDVSSTAKWYMENGLDPTYPVLVCHGDVMVKTELRLADIVSRGLGGG